MNFLKKLFRNKWMSCSKRLPEESGKYLCYDKPSGTIGVCRYVKETESNDLYKHGDGWYVYDSAYGGVKVYGISHWMNMPSEPSEMI